MNVQRGGREVVSGFTASVPKGAVVGLLGPSGCGKSTLMRAIVGVQARVRGTVRVLGLDAGAPALRSCIGYRAQEPALYRDLTVAENMAYFSRLVRVDGDTASALIETVRLASHADRRVDNLSGGQTARLSLAVAMLGRPKLLVLDEPTVGLDPLLRRELWRLFDEIAQAGTTLLVSSHVMDEAQRCDVLLLMREGQLLADGSPEELMASTDSDSVEGAFLALVDNRSGP